MFGKVEDKVIPRQSHEIWDVAAGFPGGYVYSMTQTGDGYLWIGTSKGLFRYDGVGFVSGRESESSAEKDSPIVGLVVDSNGQLWATDNHNHLFQYTRGRLVGPLPDSGKRQNLAGPVNRTSDGSLLFASEARGLVQYKRGAALVLVGSSSIPGSPTAVAQTMDGVFWIGTRDAGVFRVNVSRGTPEIQHVAGLPHTKINCLLPIEASTLLLGTDSGLLTLHNGRLIKESHPKLTGREIRALASSRERDVWIGTDNGVYKAEAEDIAKDGKIHSLIRLAVRFPVTSLFEDRVGDLWIGGPEMIERYGASGFATYFSSAGLPSSNCGSIYVDDEESLWFAPRDGGLFRLAQNLVQQINVGGLKDDDTVYSLAGGGHEVWAARKDRGITRVRLSPGGLRVSNYTQMDGLAENSVLSIYRAPDGTVWAGTVHEGLSRFQDGSWHTFTTKDGLPSNTISVITGNASGKIFVGTPDGLAELRNHRWVSYATHDGLPPGGIESLLLDDSGTLWIGTAKGISFLQSGTVHVPVNAPHVLFGEILGIAESHGWLWITTGTHVLRVRCSALLNNSFEAGDYREFGITEGLPSGQGVKGSPSVRVDNRGRVWFSLNEGISVLQPSAFTRPAFPVATRLDGILVDGRLIEPGDHVRVPPRRHRFTFRYAGVNISDPENVRYRYRLENVDSAWSEPTAAREVDYTNVPPGQFQFDVIASNADGRWSGQEATLPFKVLPAYWQTRWFQVVSLAALVLGAWGLYRFRLRQMSARMDLRHAERLEERSRIARELHDTLLQSFQGLMLRLQVVSDLLPKGGAKEEFEQTLERADQAIAEGRSAVYGLRASTSLTSDLAQAVKALGNELAAQDSAAFNLVVEGATLDLHPIIRDEFYRITREALRNAFTHARARHIEAEITYTQRLFRLRIRDDGEGIAPATLEDGRAGHYGLRGMHERAKQIGAKLTIWSQVRAGTEIELSIPGSIAYDTRPRRSAAAALKEAR
jgi:signal transduction histidine kinase/ligand-binding sensor domain-containing protein